jgi:hypothetical protein
MSGKLSAWDHTHTHIYIYKREEQISLSRGGQII